MKTKLVAMLVVLGGVSVLAAPPERGGKWAGGDDDRGDRLEKRQREAHLMYVVAISEALELNEVEALKLSERLRSIEDKRRPLRQQMGEAMKALKDAADGDAAALAQVDANVQRVLDGRAQLAVADKELFATLSQGLAPQKRARLALVLARLNHEMKGFKKGRHGGRD